MFHLTGSVMSLAMGLLFGSLSGYGAMQTSTNPRNVMVSLGEYFIPLTYLIYIAMHFNYHLLNKYLLI